MSSRNGTSTANVDASVYTTPSSEEKSSSPLDYLYTLWRGKWLILTIVCLFGGGAYLYYQNKPYRYKTSAELLLEESEQPKRVAEFLPSQSSNRVRRELYFLRHSQTFAKKVARALRKKERRSPSTDGELLYTSADTLPSVDALAGRVRRVVSVRRDVQDIPALRIGVTSSSPEQAARVANTYAETYQKHLRHANSARMRTVRRFLTEQKQEMKGRLRVLEDSIASRVRTSGQLGLRVSSDSGVGITGTARQLADKISNLHRQKKELALKLSIKNTLLDSAEARLGRIRPNLADRASSTTSSKLRQVHKRIAKLENEIQTIKAHHETLSAEVRKEIDQRRERIRTLQAQADQLARTYIDQALSTDAIDPFGKGGSGTLSSLIDLRQKIMKRRLAVTRLSARQDVVTKRLDKHRAALEAAPNRTLARLQRRKNTLTSLLMSVSKRLQQAQVAEETAPEQARIVQRASPSTVPISSGVWGKVVQAILLGGALGGGIVLLYDQLDDVVEEPDDLVTTSEDLFGTIPTWEADESSSGDTTRRQWPGIVPPLSLAAEAYRHIATNIRLGLPNESDILLVTSPAAQEGKTTTAANLGVMLTEAGQDVLLVDADLRGANLHRLFGADRRPGLTDRLAGVEEGIQSLQSAQSMNENEATDASSRLHGPLSDVLRETQEAELGKLGLLSAGTDVPQPTLLLQECHVQEPLQTLTESWDVVLLDTPPALLYDDAFRIAGLSDLVVLLSAAGATRYGAFQDVRTRLASVCGENVVSVLNRYQAMPNTQYGYRTTSYASGQPDEEYGPSFVDRLSHGVRRIVKG